MRRALAMVGALAMFGLAAAPAARAQEVCVGDCCGDGMVAINELIIGVNIALDAQPITACEAFDCMGTGMVPISCLIQGVNNALNGCGPRPTPTATPTTGTFRDRVFTIAPGGVSEPPDTSKSGVFTTGLGGANAAVMFAPGPLTLQLGPADSSGIASLRLEEDIFINVEIIDGSRLCLRLIAADSSGSVDCDGGTPYDIDALQVSSEDILFTLQTGLGDPAGPGNGNLLVNMDSQAVPAGDLTPCPDVVYTDPRQLFGFTTTNATSKREGVDFLTVHGEPFDCATWEQPSGTAQLATPAPRFNRVPVSIEVNNVIRFGEEMP